jgi:hypothetical protein
MVSVKPWIFPLGFIGKSRYSLRGKKTINNFFGVILGSVTLNNIVINVWSN